MKRIEPNLLLAATTAVPLALLVSTAAVFGVAGQGLKYVVLAVVVPLAYLPLKAVLDARAGWNRPPMIHPEAASTAAWASLFPLFVIFAAAVPVFFPGHDYGLLVIVAAVLFAGTVESALKARR